MNVKTAKVLRNAARTTLLVCVFLLLGLGIYYTYLSIRFRPYKVRVSNVTDSAFTVSWVTDEPMVGVVYYGDKDSFLPGPLSWLGKKRAFDDRDVSDAQTECVSKFNKKVSKSRDENFTVDASGFDCNDVKVIKKGQYYTHHVTVPNLDADKEYYFRVGNGYISFKEGKTKGIEYIEREMPAVGEFKQKTRETIKDISSPKPAYGTSFNFYRKSDGFIGMKKNFDSIIFLKTFKEGTEYPLMSAVTNSGGGWSIDLSNVRDKNNNVLALEGSSFEFIPQVDNARPGANGVTKYEDVKFPLRILGNDSDDWGESKSSSLDNSIEESELGALLKGLVVGVGAYGYDDEDRIECWRIGDCQYKVFNTGACPSGYTPVKDKCQTTTPPPKVDNPLCCSATCNCKTDWVTCPGGYTKYESKAACLKAKETETKVSCCVQSGPSDCQCITNRDEGSCRGDYPNQYNTNNKADAIAQCKANLPPPPKVDNNCYTYDSKNNKCLGPKACTSGTMSFRECQDKRKKGLGLGGSKTCCKINIEGGCSCLYDQKKCTGLYREYSSKDDCKDARVTPIGDTITTTGGCTSDGRTPPTYVPVRVTGITNQSIAMQHRGILDILRSKVFALSGYGGSGTWETACDVGVEDSACYSYYNYDDERICEDCNESNGDCALCKPNTEKKCQDGQKLCPKLEYGTVDDTLTSDSDCTSSEVLEQIASKQETECKEYWRHTDCAVIYRKDDPGPGYTNVRKECKGSNLEVADPSGNTHLLGNGCIVKVGDKYETAPNMTRTIVSGGCNSCYVEYVSKDNVYCGNAQVNNVFCGNSLTEVGCNNQRAPVIGCGEECKTDECVCASNCEGNGGEKITNQVDDNGAKPACGGLVVKNEQKQFCCNEDCDCNEQESGSSCSKGYNPRVGLNIDEATSTCQHDQQAFLCNDSCSCLALSNLEYDLEGEIVYADSLNEATATCNSSKSEKQFYCYKENCECYDISGVSYYFSQNFSQIANTLVFVSANDEAGAKVICKGNVKTFCCDNLCSCTESSSEEDSCAEKGIPIKAIDSSKARNACRAAKYCVYNGNTGSFMFERYGYSISDKYPCPTNTLPGYGMCYTVKVGECSSSFIAADDPLVECWKSEDGCRNDKTIKTTLSNCSKIGYIDEISCRYRSEEKENLCWDGKKSRFYTPARGIEENNPNKTVYVCFQPKDILKSSYGTPGCTSGGYYDTFTDCIKAKDGKEPLCYKADGTSCKESKNFSDCYDDSGQLKQGAYLESIVCTKNLIDTAPDVSTLGRCEDSVCSCGDGVISKDYCCQTQLFTYDVKDNAPSSDCKVDKKSEENHVAPIGNRKFCSEDECKINKESVVLKALEDKELPTIGYDSDTQKICARKKTGTDEEKTCKLREWSTLEGWINKRNYNICELKNCITSGGTGGGSLPFIPKAYAEGSEESLENHSFISYYPDDGIYQVTDGKGRTASAIGGTGGYVYYEERNGEDGYQSPEDPQNPKDNEDLIVPRSSFVKVEKVASLLDLSLKKGINIISFNLLPSVGGVDSKLTYADFLAIANRKDENVSRIATFKGGQWEGGAVYNFDTKEIKGQKEEVLTMGKGYLVMAEKDTTISVPGYAIQSPIPIAFSSGWNLIGVHGHDTQYTAKSLINSVNSIEGLKANNVTYWPTSKGMYQGFQLSEGQEYGQDFPISKDLGYFVRINEIKKDCKSIWWNPDGEGNGKCN